MFHKKDAKWNEGEWFDDYEMWLRFASEKKTFYNVGENLVYHRVHKKSFFNINFGLHESDIGRLRNKYQIIYQNNKNK